MDGDAVRFIKQEIAKQLNIILSGSSGDNTQFTEDIQNMFAGMPTITARPVMHPYGISSRAPNGTIQVVGKQGDHAGNRLVLGHRDKDRPLPAAQGGTILYDAFGHQVVLSESKMQFGSAGSTENMVLGQVFKTMMNTLLTALAAHTHIGNLGFDTAPPSNAADFNQIKSSPIGDDAILSAKCFTEV